MRFDNFARDSIQWVIHARRADGSAELAARARSLASFLYWSRLGRAGSGRASCGANIRSSFQVHAWSPHEVRLKEGSLAFEKSGEGGHGPFRGLEAPFALGVRIGERVERVKFCQPRILSPRRTRGCTKEEGGNSYGGSKSPLPANGRKWGTRTTRSGSRSKTKAFNTGDTENTEYFQKLSSDLESDPAVKSPTSGKGGRKWGTRFLWGSPRLDFSR